MWEIKRDGKLEIDILRVLEIERRRVLEIERRRVLEIERLRVLEIERRRVLEIKRWSVEESICQNLDPNIFTYILQLSVEMNNQVLNRIFSLQIYSQNRSKSKNKEIKK